MTAERTLTSSLDREDGIESNIECKSSVVIGAKSVPLDAKYVPSGAKSVSGCPQTDSMKQ